MTNLLKIKTKINCSVCGCNLNRIKIIKVNSTTQREAELEVNEKINNWKTTLKNANCKICASIIKDLKHESN